MKFLPTTGLIVTLALQCSITFSQKTAIVLINEQATKVELTDGEITAVYNAVPGHMNGYSKAPNDDFRKIPLQQLDTDRLLAVQQSADPADKDLFLPEPEEPATDESNALNQAVYFDFESAILSNEALGTIENYADVLKARQANSVLLKSWYKNGDANSEKLVKNRLDACRAYLETQGVGSNIILTSLIGSNRESRFVSLILN